RVDVPLSGMVKDIVYPSLFNITVQPEQPTVDDSILITAQATDDSGIASVLLNYSLGENFSVLEMYAQGNDTYEQVIDPSRATGNLTFQIIAIDLDNNTNVSDWYVREIFSPIMNIEPENVAIGPVAIGEIVDQNITFTNKGSSSLSATLFVPSFVSEVNGSSGDLCTSPFIATGDDDGRIYLLPIYPNGSVGQETFIGQQNPLVRGIGIGDFDGNRNCDLVVADGSGTLQLYPQVSNWTLSNPQLIGNFTANDYGMDMAVADFNNDRNMDVALSGNDDVLLLFLGLGNGSFGEPTFLALQGYGRGKDAGDVDHDGNNDLVVGTSGQDLEFYRGQGNGSFSSREKIPYPFYDTYTVILGDFDNDHHLDIISSTYWYYDTLNFLKGYGNGSFAAYQPIDVDLNNYIRGGDAIDLNRDGNLDLIVSNADWQGRVYLLEGKGNGSFGAPVQLGYVSGSYRWGIATPYSDNGMLITVDANSQAIIPLKVSTQLPGGYNDSLVVRSNDPRQQFVALPFTLDVRDDDPPILETITTITQPLYVMDNVTIETTIHDNSGIKNRTLLFSQGEGPFQYITMDHVSGTLRNGTYRGIIPATVVPMNVTYAVMAEDLGSFVISSSNITYRTTTSPVITNVSWNPAYPNVNEPITLSAIITDDRQVVEAILSYNLSSGETANLTLIPTNVSPQYSALLPSVNETTEVQFVMTATDDDNFTSQSQQYAFIIDGESPTIQYVTLDPEFPNATTTVIARAKLDDNVGIANATLFYHYLDNNMTFEEPMSPVHPLEEIQNSSGQTNLPADYLYWDTYNGAYINDGGQDAYDGMYYLRLNDRMYSAYASLWEANGREIVFAPQDLDGLMVQRKFYAPQSGYWARYLDVISNPSNATRTVTLDIYGNLGSDGATITWATEERWLGTDDYNATGDPTLAHVYGNDATVSRVSDGLTISQVVSIPANESLAFVTFAIKVPDQSIARALADEINEGFENELNEYNEFLSGSELAAIHNWDISRRVINRVMGWVGTILPSNHSVNVSFFIAVSDYASNGITSAPYGYFADGEPPVILNVSSDIDRITPLENVTIETFVADAGGMREVHLWYTFENSSPLAILMNQTEGDLFAGRFMGTIPPTNIPLNVTYRIEAIDRSAQVSQSSVFSYLTTTAPIINQLTTVPPLFSNRSFTLYLLANITDVDDNLVGVNFSLYDPFGQVILDNVAGQRDGDLFTSPTVFVDLLGVWNYTVLAIDADQNVVTQENTFFVDQIYIDQTIDPSTVYPLYPVTIDGNLSLVNGSPLVNQEFKVFINETQPLLEWYERGGFITDESGQYHLILPAPVELGTYSVKVNTSYLTLIANLEQPLTVTYNNPPVIIGIPNQTIQEDTPSTIYLDLFNYTSDLEQNLSDLVFVIESQTRSDVIRCSIIGNHFVTCNNPEPNASGLSEIVVSAHDGSSKGYGNFSVTVLPINDPPVILPLPNLSINEDELPPQPWLDLYNYTVDIDDNTTDLVFTLLNQSNESLIRCTLRENQYVTCDRPAVNQFGSSTLHLEVRDLGGLTDEKMLTVTVLSVNDLPNITVLSPLGEFNTTEPLQSVAFTVEDIEQSTNNCQLLINGKMVDEIVAYAHVPTNLTARNLTEGRKSWFIRCYDDAGFSTSNEQFFNVFTDLSLTSEQMLMIPPYPLEGERTTLLAGVRNLGSVAVDRVAVSFYLENLSNLIGTVIVSVPANGSANASILWTAESGTHEIFAYLDPELLVFDSNRSNDLASRLFTITPDTFSPSFSVIEQSPLTVTEHTTQIIFSVQVTDQGVGVDPSTVLLNYTIDDISATKLLTHISGDIYRTNLSAGEIDFDNYQGKNLTFFAVARDFNNNPGISDTGSLFITPINDIPILTIIEPDNRSQWGRINTISFSVNNDEEGPVNSTLFYWEPFVWAPSYEEDPDQYFLQGEWTTIAHIGNASFYEWQTNGFSGYTRINITTNDGVYTVSNASAVFTVNNVNVSLVITNVRANDSYLTRPEAQITGEINAYLSDLATIAINDSRFTLTLDPRGKRKANFSFLAQEQISEPFSVTINASDLAGNTGEINATMYIDAVLPQILNATFENAFTNDLITLVVNVSDDIGVKKVLALLPFNATDNFTNATQILELTQRTPPEVNNGTFSGTFKAPPFNGTYPTQMSVFDYADNNFTQDINLDVVSGVDLTLDASNITTKPSELMTGDPITLRATIRNIGGKFALNVPVVFMAYNQTIGIDVVNVTSPMQQALAEIEWTTTGFAGTVPIHVVIEETPGVYESNRTNNNASTEFFIDGPDLAIGALSFRPSSPVFEGEVVNATVSIMNLKNISVRDVRLTFYENVLDLEHRIDFTNIDVPAYGIVNVSTPWQTAGLFGVQYMIVEVNTFNLPAEPDRSNNILNESITTERYVPENIPDLLTFPKKSLPSIPGEQVRGLASNDFNQDNKTDFIAGTNTGKVFWYRNDGVFLTDNNKTKNVLFTPVLIADLGEKAWGMTSADVLGDGYPDAIVGTESGRVIFYNNSEGTFTDNLTLFDAGTWAYGLAATDVNNDNLFDLVVGHKIGHVDFYINTMQDTGINDTSLTNTTFVFNKTITNRDMPFGMTTGDYDLDGHVDIMVGDMLGQIERIVFEDGSYNGFIFADLGSFAHGLTTADIDYSDKLDLFALGFDGNVRLYFSREGGLVADPLIIGTVPNSFGLTAGDYDADNDIDLIVGSENGSLTMLMNSLIIEKSIEPLPTPPRRIVEVESRIENPWAREMINLTLIEEWYDQVRFVESAYPVCIKRDEYGRCVQYFYGDLYFFATPQDHQSLQYKYYLDFPNRICRESMDSCDYITTIDGMQLFNRSFVVNDPLAIFDGLQELFLREGFSFRYKLLPNEVTDLSTTSILNYTLKGSFNTPMTDYLLSDDVSNMNNAIANTKNINPSRWKSDRGSVDNLVIAPDFIPVDLTYSGFTPPLEDGDPLTVTATIQNLNNIAIDDVNVMFFGENETLRFGCPQCKNDTTFSIGPYGTARVSATAHWFASYENDSNFTVVVNPFFDDVETNYENNNFTNMLLVNYTPPEPPVVLVTDLSNDNILFANGMNITSSFTEGDVLTVYTNVTNIGLNQSRDENIAFLGFMDVPPPQCGRVIPRNIALNCTLTSPLYNRDFCGGSVDCYGKPCTFLGDLQPNVTATTSYAYTLGDYKQRSQGIYNFSTVIANVVVNETNPENNAQYGTYVVLPSQPDIQFSYNQCDILATKGIKLTNPTEEVMQLNYEEVNIGGYDLTGYDVVIYLDNNDSMILAEAANNTIQNHSESSRAATINWSNVPPGDHNVYAYLDYGTTPEESTARAMTPDNLTYRSRIAGITGNNITVSIEQRETAMTELRSRHDGGSTLISVTSVAGLAVGDTIRLDKETRHQITDINESMNTLNITPGLTKTLEQGTDLFLVHDDLFRVIIKKSTEVVTQTAFDLTIHRDVEEYVYDKLADNMTDIQIRADVVEVITSGGFTLNGTFTPSTLIFASAENGNLTERPMVGSVQLVIPGSLPHERSDFYHEKSTVFQWKELVMGNLVILPDFPLAGDMVMISSSVENKGDIRTGLFNATLYVNGEPEETKTLSLLAHETKPLQFTYRIPETESLGLDILVVLDPENTITHEDESNNDASGFIPLSASFELNLLSREHEINFLSSYEQENDTFGLTMLNLDGIAMEYDATPRFVDYDSDGDLDLIIGSRDGGLRSFNNTGSNPDPQWEETDWYSIDWRQDEVPSVQIDGKIYPAVSLAMLDVSARSAPFFVDLDGDSLPELIVGDTYGKLHTYKRVIVSKQVYNPEQGEYEWITKKTLIVYDFDETGNLSLLPQTPRAVPVFADLDGDSDNDLVMGNQQGKLTGYMNTGNQTNPQWVVSSFMLDNISGASDAAPYFVDLDGDDDDDLVLGHRDGILFFMNRGNTTTPLWEQDNLIIREEGKTNYRPVLAHLDADQNLDLVVGANNETPLKLRRGYFEPVNVQVVNFAKREMDISRIKISAVNSNTGMFVTDLFTDGPSTITMKQTINQQCGKVGTLLSGYRLPAESALEREYDLDIAQDLPVNTSIRVRASKQENINPSYYISLGPGECKDEIYPYMYNPYYGGTKGSPVFIYRPELGGNTFDIFVRPEETYEYQGSYRIFVNGSMSGEFTCAALSGTEGWCPLYNLTPGMVNTIVGSGELHRLLHRDQGYALVTPEEPPLVLLVDNKLEMELKPGYVEDINLSMRNNNRRTFTINRLAFELFNQGNQTGTQELGNGTNNITVPVYANATIISLFTDVSGVSLSPGTTTQKSYKIYIPEGVPLDAMLLVKAIERYNFRDDQYDRSNIEELWPEPAGVGFLGDGFYYRRNLSVTSLYNTTNPLWLTNPDPWGHQPFSYGVNTIICPREEGFPIVVADPDESFLRKNLWLPRSLIKAEQKNTLTQNCYCPPAEPFGEPTKEAPSALSLWINGDLQFGKVTECGNFIYGWAPNFDELSLGQNNQFDLYSMGPHRSFDITFYDALTMDYVAAATVPPRHKAFDLEITNIGSEGFLQRQHEELINMTIINNDDDPITVRVISYDLITPQGREIHLGTDTTPMTIPPLSMLNLTKLIQIPIDVPLHARLRVQVERIFTFPDLLWNRNKEITLSELIAQDTRDYHWGDTLPTTEESNYRKHFFAPTDITRSEMLLGDESFETDVYLNGEFQGSGYPGWSPISVTSSLRQGQDNLISVAGAIPDTQNMLYAGVSQEGGEVVEPEEDVFFTVFGMREQQYSSEREPFFVSPGEDITARIRLENKYNKTLVFDLIISAVDFETLSEMTLSQNTLTVGPKQTKDLEVDLRIPLTFSNQTRLQLSSVWKDELADKNWLRGSNFNDDQAKNKFLDDSQWGVVAVGPANERAIYFRKHFWVDATVNKITLTTQGVANTWINGLPVMGNELRNEFTKSETNMIALKANNYDIDATITLDHFVPVRSTDLEFTNHSYSSMIPLSQGDLSCFENQELCDCTNQSRGICTYTLGQGEPVFLNVTLRNTGELFSKNFDLRVYARNLLTNKTTEFKRETITMHPFSSEEWMVSWDTKELAGFYDFIVGVDGEDVIIETFERNNEATRRIYVNAAPVIHYLAAEELKGYQEPVTIHASIEDKDNNLEEINVSVLTPVNATKELPVQNSTNSTFTFTFISYNSSTSGRYFITTNVYDGLGKNARASRYVDIFDSLYLNVKTTKDQYYAGQTVTLQPPKLTNLRRIIVNTQPQLLDAFDGTEAIKGGARLTVQSRSFDPDGDLLTLYVCGTHTITATGCTGQTYCQSSAYLSPTCSFLTEQDDLLHTWFAAVVDEKGSVSMIQSDTYQTDSTPPLTRLSSFAGEQDNHTGTFIDTLDDAKTMITVEGEPGMKCRFGKDSVYRFHKDRSYTHLRNECSVSGAFANCNLGNLTREDTSRDKITNLTMAYISCTDALGNDQRNTENLDILFGVEPATQIYDDYQGEIIAPGSTITLQGTTKYCVDDSGRCLPDQKIAYGSIPFTTSGVKHLRYLDANQSVRDILVLVNSEPVLGNQIFYDSVSEHATDVWVTITDVDNQELHCTLAEGNITYEMVMEQGFATSTLHGDAGQLLTTTVTCTDGFVEVSTPEQLHTLPNQAPFIRNIPDISLEHNEEISLDIGFFGTDLESDALVYTLLNQTNEEIVVATLEGTNLSVRSSNQSSNDTGKSTVCFTVHDGLASSNPSCVDLFVENGEESKLKNNELQNTTVRLFIEIEYYNTTVEEWSDELVLLTESIKMLPDASNQLDLSRIFHWNSSLANHTEGLFRVIFTAVDENNMTLINRDGRAITALYNFTIVLFNSAPNMTNLPDQFTFENRNLQPAMSLLDYTTDNEQNIENLTYSILNQSNTSLIGCLVEEGYYLSCYPVENQTGTSEITVQVFDGFASSEDTFAVTVVSYEKFLSQSANLTYIFVSEEFNLSGDPLSGYRAYYVTNETQAGEYIVMVIVSDGLLNVSENITVKVVEPGTPLLLPIGDRNISVNQTLIIQLNASDPNNDTLTFSTNAAEVLSSNFTFNASTGFFSWTPLFEDVGWYDVVFNVTDGFFWDAETVRITVFISNHAPVLEDIGNQSIKENATLLIQLHASDPDNDTLLFSTNAEMVLPENVSFNENSGVLNWTPTFDDSGDYLLLFNVTDGEFSDEEIITLVVENVNRAPVLFAIPPQTIFAGQTLIIEAHATDPDNDTLLFGTNAAEVLPSPFVFNNSTGFFSWIPSENNTGVYTVTFNVTDGNLSDEKIAVITVLNRITTLVAMKDSFLRNGDDDADGVTTDEECDDDGDGDVCDANEGANEQLYLQKAGAEEVLVVFNVSGVMTEKIQEAWLILSVADIRQNWGPSGKFVAAYPILEDWAEGNGWGVGHSPPIIGNGSGVTWHCAVDEDIANHRIDCDTPWNGGTFGPATTPGVLHPYNVTTEARWNVTKDLKNNSFFGWIIKPDDDDESENGWVIYYAKEGARARRNLSLAPRLVISYESPRYIKHKPVLYPLENMNLTENEDFSLTLNATDLDDSILRFSTNAAEVLPSSFVFNESTGMFFWIPTFNDSGTYTLTFTVTDGLLNDTKQTIVHVANRNRQPLIVSPPVTQAISKQAYQYAVEALDPDLSYGDLVNYSLPLAPQGMVIDPLLGTITWVPSEEQIGEHPVRIVVSDREQSQDSQSYTLLVKMFNRRPLINVTMYPKNPEPEALLHCSGLTEDSDGDNVSVNYSIFSGRVVNGQLLRFGESPDQPADCTLLDVPGKYNCTTYLSNVTLVRGEVLACRMTPFDGKERGEPAMAMVTIKDVKEEGSSALNKTPRGKQTPPENLSSE
ncbi:VCBS repeat-containing protein, partial [Candidatus Woesearchaeota archaeon]|nr:VCBS repeat-containing protein [Candidatus Woesearchaeota archaeon]